MLRDQLFDILERFGAETKKTFETEKMGLESKKNWNLRPDGRPIPI